MEKIGKRYCANCKHCKVVRKANSDGSYKRLVRCAAGHWKKKLGGEKLYAYDSVDRRDHANICPDYDEMGETKVYMKELKKKLRSKDNDVYIVD